MEITTVGKLRAFLAGYVDGAPLVCQVVGSDSGVWNMFLQAYHNDELAAQFNWPTNPVLLQMTHPSIKNLPLSNSLVDPAEVGRYLQDRYYMQQRNLRE